MTPPASSISASIARMLRPRAVAVAGVSATPGSLGGQVVANLERFGFTGDVHIIHPKRTELLGRVCVPSPRDLPDGVDCVVLAIPGAAVLDAVKDCAARGVAGVIVFSAGFAEAGDDGEARQRELAAIARRTGMIVLGPNCLGVVNYVDGVCLTFGGADPMRPDRPAAAILSQSGAMASVIRAALHARNLPVALTVSTGNEAVNGIEDFLAHAIEDPTISVITLVAEQIRRPRELLALAAHARSAGKPIVLLHPGRSAAARESAITHTGAMTGDWDVTRTLVEHACIGLVGTMDELIDVTEMMLRWPKLPSKGPLVFGESGCFKALVLDLAEEVGLDLPPPAGTSREVLDTLAPGLILPTNPVDLTAQPLVDPDLYTRALPPLAQDDRYGSVVLAMILSSPALAARKTEPVLKAIDSLPDRNMPMVYAMLGDEAPVPHDYVARFRDLGIPFIRSPDRVIRALATVTKLGARLEQSASAIPLQPQASTERLPPGVIPEHRAKALLAAAGLPVPPSALAATLAEAEAAAARIGYPVALKAQSAELSHKSDAGGVILGLKDPQDLRKAWPRLEASIARVMPGLALDGVLVERMAPRDGLEMILGVRNDPAWGPVIALGLGGVQAEALADVRLIPADLPAEAIAAELGKLRAARLLGPFRGAPPRDVTAAAEAVGALGRFVLAHPEIAEIDINPLMVLAAGEAVLVLDALIAVRA
jgi:acyl-CoA synthetase (NDP forming)